MALDEDATNDRVEAVLSHVIGLPIVEAVTILCCATGLALKAAGADVPRILKYADQIVNAIPQGKRLMTLIRG